MAALRSRRRRSRYAARAHDIETRPPVRAVSPPADEITWRTRPGEAVAHAYSSGAGWMRSVCRREPWSVLWAEAAPEVPHCFECVELLTPEPCARCADREATGRGPRHEASPLCQSGGHPHCSCDVCF